MSAVGETVPVDEEYHREKKREQKAMDSLTAPKFSAEHLSKVFDDNRSVGSTKSAQPLLARIFFENATTRA
jgi:hypothetical protein